MIARLVRYRTTETSTKTGPALFGQVCRYSATCSCGSCLWVLVLLVWSVRLPKPTALPPPPLSTPITLAIIWLNESRVLVCLKGKGGRVANISFASHLLGLASWPIKSRSRRFGPAVAGESERERAKEFVTVFPVCARTRASADRRRGVPENKPQQQLVLGGYKTMSLGIVSAQFANSPGKCGTDTHPKEVSKALNSDFVKKNATNYSSK